MCRNMISHSANLFIVVVVVIVVVLDVGHKRTHTPRDSMKKSYITLL